MLLQSIELTNFRQFQHEKIEFSTDGGTNWRERQRAGVITGTFIDLLPYGNELLAVTTNGIFSSSDSGLNWNQRCRERPTTGRFISLAESGSELLAITSNGLFSSTDRGVNWRKK